jgi:hypothetical protein
MARLPGVPDAGWVILSAVDRAVETRWDRALRTAAATTAASVEGRVTEVGRNVARELAATGAAAGGTAAVPGVGTLTAVGTATAELAWFGLRTADLVLAVAAVHGHTEAEVLDRRAWVLSVLAFGESAAAGFTAAAGEIGPVVGRNVTGAIPTEWIRAANRSLGRTIITKWGARRGGVAIGRLVPFGIGAAIGGSANYLSARAVTRQAHAFFRDLPPMLATSVRDPDPDPA